ncbi:MAG: hypothetical protein WHX52_02710 [Anaerolineae bacterium]
MSDETTKTNILHEATTRYVVDARQRPLGFLLTPEEYEHYLRLLHTETTITALDDEVTARLNQIYALEPSSMDPDLLQLQLASVDQASW